MAVVDERPVRSGEVELDPPRPALRPELQHALRREIEQAIKPVLADFREQSVRAVRQQVDQSQRAERSETPPAPEPGREATRPRSRQDDHEVSSTDGTSAPALRGHPTAPALPASSELPRSTLEFLERLGTQWVQSRVEDGRDALCAEPLRARIRESIERVFHPLLEAGLELVPGAATRRELEQDTERLLDELVEDALEHFCSEGMLAELQRHAEAAFHAVVRLDVATMLREIWQAIRALLRALLAAAQDEWQRLLHLLLHFILKATQEMVGTLLKSGLASIVAVPVEEIEGKAEEAKETVEDRLTEVRDRLAERIGTLQDRVKEEVDQVKERVAEGLKSAVEGGTQSDKFGRPPTGRPPSLRPPTGRPPGGRPPSGRPPTGRPPSLTRRHA